MAVTTTTRHSLSKQGKSDPDWHTALNSTLDALDLRLPWSYAGDPNSNVAGQYIGQPVWDSTNGKQYVCTTTGDAATAVWTESSSDGKQKVSADDTTPGYLEDKLLVGTGLALTTQSGGGNETRTINLDFPNTPNKSTTHSNDSFLIKDSEAANATKELTYGNLLSEIEADFTARTDVIDTDAVQDDAITADKLANTAVTPGTYTFATVTVDAQGRITSASSGTTPTSDVVHIGNYTGSGSSQHNITAPTGYKSYLIRVNNIQVNAATDINFRLRRSSTERTIVGLHVEGEATPGWTYVSTTQFKIGYGKYLTGELRLVALNESAMTGVHSFMTGRDGGKPVLAFGHCTDINAHTQICFQAGANITYDIDIYGYGV